MSNSGHDFSVSVQKHGSPYTNYGLNRYPVNLVARWQTLNIQFTTSGFSSPVSDGRLMFWMADADPGDIFTIDNVVLKPCN
jgi:hypothetical protein